ncbi:hypothetical protein SODG_005085 [Sodalis praecaptivus]
MRSARPQSTSSNLMLRWQTSRKSCQNRRDRSFYGWRNNRERSLRLRPKCMSWVSVDSMNQHSKKAMYNCKCSRQFQIQRCFIIQKSMR